MSERGVFAVDRGIWDHDVLSENAPYSRREVWLWLLSEAAWKPHRRRVAGRSIGLNRGQLAASLRFMAEKWRWSEPKVRRFLKLLKSELMIDAAADAGITIITICKYHTYQRVSLPTDARTTLSNDARATQERRKVEGIEHKEDSIAAAVDARGDQKPVATISEDAFTLARQVIDAIGPAAIGSTIEVGAPAHCQKWLNEGWVADYCLIAVKRVMGRGGRKDDPPRTLKFFDKAISQYHAEITQPLPKITIPPQDNFYVSNSNHSAQKSQSFDRHSPMLAGLQRVAESLPRHGDN